MNRLVYLFELDSVRKYERGHKKGVLATPGVNALFCEIINRGNSVAITMNQLTDSQFIREALADDVAYTCLLRLFELGALKVSLYGKIRTASQYIQKAVNKCLDDSNDSFIFSNLPVKSDDRELLLEIRDALQFSDLSALQDKTENTSGEEQEKMTAIYRFVNMVLQLSVCETSNIPPKPPKAAKGGGQAGKEPFELFLEKILAHLSSYDFLGDSFDALIANAVDIIEERGKNISDGRGNRSNWLNTKAEKGTAEYVANEIINICYNYTVEDSINGVSRHYEEGDLEDTFKKDLVNRVYLYCTAEEEAKLGTVPHSRWRTAVRFAEYKADSKEKTVTQMYEEDFHKEKTRWIFFLLLKNLGALAVALMYIALFCIAEIGVSWAEDNFAISLDNFFAEAVLSAAIFGLLGSLIGVVLKFINRGDDVPDILESILDIIVHFCDFWRAWGGIYGSYRLY